MVPWCWACAGGCSATRGTSKTPSRRRSWSWSARRRRSGTEVSCRTGFTAWLTGSPDGPGRNTLRRRGRETAVGDLEVAADPETTDRAGDRSGARSGVEPAAGEVSGAARVVLPPRADPRPGGRGAALSRRDGPQPAGPGTRPAQAAADAPGVCPDRQAASWARDRPCRPSSSPKPSRRRWSPRRSRRRSGSARLKPSRPARPPRRSGPDPRSAHDHETRSTEMDRTGHLATSLSAGGASSPSSLRLTRRGDAAVVVADGADLPGVASSELRRSSRDSQPRRPRNDSEPSRNSSTRRRRPTAGSDGAIPQEPQTLDAWKASSTMLLNRTRRRPAADPSCDSADADGRASRHRHHRGPRPSAVAIATGSDLTTAHQSDPASWRPSSKLALARVRSRARSCVEP